MASNHNSATTAPPIQATMAPNHTATTAPTIQATMAQPIPTLTPTQNTARSERIIHSLNILLNSNPQQNASLLIYSIEHDRSKDIPPTYALAYLLYLASQSNLNICIVPATYDNPTNPGQPKLFCTGVIKGLHLIIVILNQLESRDSHWQWAIYDLRTKELHHFMTSTQLNSNAIDAQTMIDGVALALQKAKITTPTSEFKLIMHHEGFDEIQSRHGFAQPQHHRHDDDHEHLASLYLCIGTSQYLRTWPNCTPINPFNPYIEKLRILRSIKEFTETNQLIPYEPPNTAPAATPPPPPIPTPTPAPQAPIPQPTPQEPPQQSITLPNGVQFIYLTGNINTIMTECGLQPQDFNAVARNHHIGLTADSLYTFLRFLQLHLDTRFVLINPQYFAEVSYQPRPAPPAPPTPSASPAPLAPLAPPAPPTFTPLFNMNSDGFEPGFTVPNFTGDPNDVQLIIMPIYLSGHHYASAIYTRPNNTVLYFDSLNWALSVPIRRRILEAIRDLIPSNNTPMTIIDHQQIIGQHNQQIDRDWEHAYRCGWHCGWLLESYLLTGNTFIPNLETEAQKNEQMDRIMNMLFILTTDRYPEYMLPPYIQQPNAPAPTPAPTPMDIDLNDSYEGSQMDTSPPTPEIDHHDDNQSNHSNSSHHSMDTAKTPPRHRSSSDSPDPSPKRPKLRRPKTPPRHRSASSSSSDSSPDPSPERPKLRRSTRIAANKAKPKPAPPPPQGTMPYERKQKSRKNAAKKAAETTKKQQTRATTSPTKKADIRKKNAAQHKKAYNPKTHMNTDTCHRNHPLPQYACAARSAGHWPDYLSCGNIGDHICGLCKALLLPSETPSICCSNGRVQLTANPGDKPFPDAPQKLLYDLYSTQNLHPGANTFKTHSILYNTLLMLGRMDCKRNYAQGRGHPAFTLNGNLQYRTLDLLPGQGYQPIGNQLYFIDPDQAHLHRLNNLTTKKNPTDKSILEKAPKFDTNLMQAIETELRIHHPYARTLKTAHTVLEEERQKAAESGTTVPDIVIVIQDPSKVPRSQQQPNIHQGQLNPATRNDLAGVHVVRHGEPVPGDGYCIYTHSQYGMTFIPDNSPIRPALIYPLLFQTGLPFFRKGIPVRTKEQIQQARNQTTHDNDSDNSSNSDDNYQSPEDKLQEAIEHHDENLTATAPGTGRRTTVSYREFFKYVIRLLKTPNDNHWLWGMRGLALQFVIDIYWEIRKQEFSILKNMQKTETWRSAQSDEMRKYYSKGLPTLKDGRTAELGFVLIPTANVRGSPAYYEQAFNKSMAIMRRFGPNALFITFTGNSGWPEIIAALMQDGQQSYHRPDIESRVFEAKLQELITLLRGTKTTHGLFGPCAALFYSVEYQKRGMPHAHIIVIIDQAYMQSVNHTEYVDEMISAEIPPIPDKNDPDYHSKLRVHNYVKQFMVHTCSKTSVCRDKNNNCTKHYPMKYSNHTRLPDGQPPIYKRRSPANGGLSFTKTVNKEKRTIDNRHVVPYNATLLALFGCHINVVWVMSPTATVKYLTKYIFKGADHCYIKAARLNADGTYDFDQFRQIEFAQHIGPNEAMAAIYSFKSIYFSHTVMFLTVHEEGKQRIVHKQSQFVPPDPSTGEGGQLPAQLNLDSQMMGYMKHCDAHPEEMKDSLYTTVNQTHTWQKHNTLRKRKIAPKGGEILTIIYPVNPGKTELYAIYLLMHNVKCPRSHENLRTVNRNDPTRRRTFATFIEAAEYRNLIKSDIETERALQEIADNKRYFHAYSFTFYFAQLLLFATPSNPRKIFDKFKTHLMGFYQPPDTQLEEWQRNKEQLCLRRLSRYLTANNRINTDFGIPEPSDAITQEQRFIEEREFFEGNNAGADPEDLAAIQTIDTRHPDDLIQLNPDQQTAYDTIMAALQTNQANPTGNHQRIFHLIGPAGTGKTFVINRIMRDCERRGFNALACASTGIAATLIHRASTAHALFNIPLRYKPGHPLPVDQTSLRGQLLSNAHLIIWDECSMSHNSLFEAVDQTLRHLSPPEHQNRPFGKYIVLILGDPNQIPPIVRFGGRPAQLAASIFNTDLYRQHFQQLRLTINQRASNDPSLAEYLEQIAKGKTNLRNTDIMEVPKAITVTSEQDLIDWTYDQDSLTNINLMGERVIIATTNETAQRLNQQIHEILPGDAKVYLSAHTMKGDDPTANTQNNELGLLQDLSDPSIPEHRLEFKHNEKVMLMRNLCIQQGLCNGTMLSIVDDQPNLNMNHTITCRILRGPRRGNIVLISRFDFDYNDEDTHRQGLRLTRSQFPLKKCSAITAHKSQGHDFMKVGAHCVQPAFTDGQTYVTFSRARSFNGLRVLTGEYPATVTNLTQWTDDNDSTIPDPLNPEHLINETSQPPAPLITTNADEQYVELDAFELDPALNDDHDHAGELPPEDEIDNPPPDLGDNIIIEEEANAPNTDDPPIDTPIFQPYNPNIPATPTHGIQQMDVDSATKRKRTNN